MVFKYDFRIFFIFGLYIVKGVRNYKYVIKVDRTKRERAIKLYVLDIAVRGMWGTMTLIIMNHLL